jgi:hypothetical protein
MAGVRSMVRRVHCMVSLRHPASKTGMLVCQAVGANDSADESEKRARPMNGCLFLPLPSPSPTTSLAALARRSAPSLSHSTTPQPTQARREFLRRSPRAVLSPPLDDKLQTPNSKLHDLVDFLSGLATHTVMPPI